MSDYKPTPREQSLIDGVKLKWAKDSESNIPKTQITNPEKFSFPIGMKEDGTLYPTTQKSKESECISFKLNSNKSQEELYQIFKKSFPDFSWRKGDSDMNGKYLSAHDGEDIFIYLYLDQQPTIDGSISFDIAWENDPHRKENKKNALKDILNKIKKIKTEDKWEKISQALQTRKVFLRSTLRDKVFRCEPSATSPVWFARSSKATEYPIDSESKSVLDAVMEWQEITQEEYNRY